MFDAFYKSLFFSDHATLPNDNERMRKLWVRGFSVFSFLVLPAHII